MDYDGPIVNGPILIPHGAPQDRVFTMLPPRGIIPWFYFAYQWSTSDRDMIALFAHFDRVGVDYSLDRVNGADPPAWRMMQSPLPTPVRWPSPAPRCSGGAMACCRSVIQQPATPLAPKADRKVCARPGCTQFVSRARNSFCSARCRAVGIDTICARTGCETRLTPVQLRLTDVLQPRLPPGPPLRSLAQEAGH